MSSRALQESEIVGVEIKHLLSHQDERGFFREILRFNDDIFDGACFAQWSHSRMIKNVVKAWHYHHVQTDWWYVPIGQVLTVLFDNRAESPSYQKKVELNMGEARFGSETLQVLLRIPPGVLHGLKVLSDEAHLFYITSQVYNPQEEGRIPFDSPLVAQDWGREFLVVENDKRNFVPSSIRKKLA